MGDRASGNRGIREEEVCVSHLAYSLLIAAHNNSHHESFFTGSITLDGHTEWMLGAASDDEKVE